MTTRRTAIAAGVMILVTFAAGVLSVVPVLEQPGYVEDLAARRGELTSGALFQLVMVAAYLAFAVLLYPAARRADEALAVGFMAMRTVALGLHLIAVTMLAVLLALADAYAASAPQDAGAIATAIEVTRQWRDLVNHVAVIIALGLGDLLFFRAMRKARLLPAWLTGWAFGGIALAMVGSVGVLSGALTVVGAPYLLLNAPLATHGLVFAAWLIVRRAPL